MKSASSLQGFFQTEEMDLNLECSHKDICCFFQLTYKASEYIVLAFKDSSLSFFELADNKGFNSYSNQITEPAYSLKLDGSKGFVTKIQRTENKFIYLLGTSKGYILKLNLSSTALNPFPLDCDPCKQLFPCEKLGNKNKFFLSQSIIDLVAIEKHFIVIVYEFIIKVIKVV